MSFVRRCCKPPASFYGPGTGGRSGSPDSHKAHGNLPRPPSDIADQRSDRLLSGVLARGWGLLNAPIYMLWASRAGVFLPRSGQCAADGICAVTAAMSALCVIGLSVRGRVRSTSGSIACCRCAL